MNLQLFRVLPKLVMIWWFKSLSFYRFKPTGKSSRHPLGVVNFVGKIAGTCKASPNPQVSISL